MMSDATIDINHERDGEQVFDQWLFSDETAPFMLSWNLPVEMLAFYL